jgi:predicted ATPase/class 3 adenylate cyclase
VRNETSIPDQTGSPTVGRGAWFNLLARRAPARPHVLPTGTLTFFMTDVEGSTRLWDKHPQAMRAAMRRHDGLIDETAERHSGMLVRPRGEGDSRFIVFERATDALSAAAEMQRALQSENWRLPEPLWVRIAMHTGEADVRDGDYYGSAPNRCARLRGLAHGGQILLSGATHDLVRESPDRWPRDSRPRALGEHQLAGLTEPERIYELVVNGLRSDFPPLPTPQALAINLPAQLTSFIGRERERTALERQMLDPSVRLVTLVGPGGVGKTRLAIQGATDVTPAFRDGVIFVSLASTLSPDLVPSAIARSVGISERSSRPALQTLTQRLKDSQQLLVLDNFEQVLDAAPKLAELLRACPQLKVLVTSRSILRLTGEHIFEVEPMLVASADEPSTRLERSEAIRLFVDRAQSAKSDFAVSPEALVEIAHVCRLVDGLPLAIELVAARVREFSVSALHKHLAERRLPLVGRAPRDAPPRHETLRSAIAWSYGLLTAEEKALFRRLAVFAGGCTAIHASEVCGLEPQALDVLDRLTSLGDKSLLRTQVASTGELRFMMLETVREFALEQLAASNELETVGERHANTFERLLADAANHRGGPEEALWLRRLGVERDNLRTAITCALDHRRADQAHRMADNGWWFMLTYGYTREGADWLSRVLQLSISEPSTLRARVLVGAGRLADQSGDLVAAEAYLEEALQLARSNGDRHLLDLVLGGMSFVVYRRGDVDRAVALAEENVAVAQSLGDVANCAHALTRLAELLVLNCDVERGLEVGMQATQLSETIKDRGCLAAGLDTLGLAMRFKGDPQRAAALLERAVALHREFGWTTNTAEALFRWADALVLLGDFERAGALCVEGLALARDAGSRRRMANGLRLAAALSHHSGEHVRAVRLLAQAEGLYGQIGGPRNGVEASDLEAIQQLALRHVGEWEVNAIRERYAGEIAETTIAHALSSLSGDEGSTA